MEASNATQYDANNKTEYNLRGNWNWKIFSVKIWDCKVNAIDCEIPIIVPNIKEDVTIINASNRNKLNTLTPYQNNKQVSLSMFMLCFKIHKYLKS